MSLSLLGAGKAVDAAAPFDPATVSGLVGWWKADAITGKVDGDTISQWSDLSGVAHHLLQATGSLQPLYKTAIQNGKAVVRFDGVDDYLVSGPAVYSQPLTNFIVLRYRSARVGNDTAFAGSSNQMRLLRTSTGLGMYANGSVAPTITQDVQTAFHVYTAVFSGASSELRVDGGTAATGNPGVSTTAAFALAASNGSEVGPVDVGEWLIYNSTLSGTDRAAVETYLKGKWGTP